VDGFAAVGCELVFESLPALIQIVTVFFPTIVIQASDLTVRDTFQSIGENAVEQNGYV
jgi:hypothetical protein